MTWARRAESKPDRSHNCVFPQVRVRGVGGAMTDIPDGEKGDLWRCDCGRLWLRTEYAWADPSWWQRIRYAGRGYPKPPTPHSGPMVVNSTHRVSPPKDAPPPPPPPSGVRR